MSSPSNVENRRPITDRQVRSRLRAIIERIGLYNLITLVIGGLAIIAFASLAEEVFEGDFANFNSRIMLAIHSRWDTPFLDTLARTLSTIGGTAVCAVLSVALAAYWYFKGKKGDRKALIEAYTLVSIIVGGAIFTFVLKQVFHEARPVVFTPLVIETDYSFPSGHSLIAFCFYGFLALRLLSPGITNQLNFKRVFLACLAILFAASIAVSRVYLGVHYPTDILAGFLVAVFWLSACWFGRTKLLNRIPR